MKPANHFEATDHVTHNNNQSEDTISGKLYDTIVCFIRSRPDW